MIKFSPIKNILLILTCLTCSIITMTTEAEDVTIPVFVSIPPQKYFVEQIGGSHVKVSAMVSAGHSPATYEPTPEQMMALNAAQLYFQIGVPFEEAWMKKIASLNPNLRIIPCCHALANMEISATHTHGQKEHGHHIDPHIWTSPKKTEKLAQLIKEALIQHDPAHRTDYEQNYNEFIAKLNSLDQDIRTQLKTIPERTFIVSHPAWGYFAREYGLTQIPIEEYGRTPDMPSFKKLIDIARKLKIRTVYVQQQFSKKSAEILAHAINGKIVSLDPLAEDYINNMKKVTEDIVNGAK